MREPPRGPAGRRMAAALTLALTTAACIRPPVVEEPPAPPLPSRTRVLAADGTLLATLFIENREPVALADVPRVAVDAVLAAEDARFFSHRGVDGRAVVRAALANGRAGRAVQGGSTITQQYVKNTYFGGSRPRTFEQKVREAQLAWKLEGDLTKEQILERYLNTVYFGAGAYGVKAAAEGLFGRAPAGLTLPEAALLAGLIRSPEGDNPRRSPERALARRSHVLGRMQAIGMISADEARTARESPLALSPPPSHDVVEPHFVEYVKQAVMENPAFGKDEEERASLLFRGGVDVVTSLDLRLQAAAREAIGAVLDRPGDPEAALVALDPGSGRVLAMVGGRDFSASQVNLALGAGGGGSGRQPGSAFKPFVMAAALDEGILPNRVYSSAPPVVRVGRTEVWRPDNIEGRGGGSMTLESAMVHSVNAVFVRLGMDVGPARVAATARRMGVTATLGAIPSISLGTEEVSVLDMASAYGTIAALGTHHPPRPVERIETPGLGRLSPGGQARRALEPGLAWLLTDVLTQVVERGTARRGRLDRPAAGKTGTSQDYADAWFVGYTPELVAAVWVGHPEGRVPMRSVHGSRVFGGTLPATIWRRFMEEALAGRPPRPFDLPESDMVTVEIDPATGLLAGPHCPAGQVVQMLRQLAPAATCPPPEPSPVPDVAEPSPEAGAGPAPTMPAQLPSATPAPNPSPSPFG